MRTAKHIRCEPLYKNNMSSQNKGYYQIGRDLTVIRHCDTIIVNISQRTI